MIDTNARAMLAQQQQTKTLIEGMTQTIKQVVESNKSSSGPSLVIKHEEDKTLVSTIEKIGQAIALIYSQVKKPITLPKVLTVQGKVEVIKQSPITITNLNELGKYFQSLEQKLTIWAQAASTAQPTPVNFPKIDFPKNEPVDMSGVITAVQSLEKALQGREKSSDTAILRKIQEGIDSLASRPVMTPQPVTNVTLNASQGYVKTTAATVGTTVTQLPSYGQLFNRRSLQIFNNSNNTIYVGGSDVSTSNGIPVLGNSYSNVFDSGYDMIIYGVASQGGNNVRCIETSKDQSANVQE